MRNLVKVINLQPFPGLKEHLIDFYARGGVLHFVPNLLDEEPNKEEHRKAALDGMKAIQLSCKKWAEFRSGDEYPYEMFFQVSIQEEKLAGIEISVQEMWGTNEDVARLNERSCSWPRIKGYRSAFMFPPHLMNGDYEERTRLFESINSILFGKNTDDCTVYSWSTNWSNYFDAGHEYWGAFFWTVYSKETSIITTIGASTTD